MKKELNIKDHIADMLQNCRFAVLATEGNGQPHASLIAITPIEGFKSLIFATYRNTTKYRNISQNSKVAVLIEGKNLNRYALQEGFVLTAFGNAEEISSTGNDSALRAHIDRHPDLTSFMKSTDCALIQIIVASYQVVNGTEDVNWYSIQELEAI